MSMQEEHLKQQRLKQAQKFLGDVAKSGFDFFKAVQVELKKDKSKLKIHQQGKNNEPKQGLKISQAAIEPEKSMRISQEVTQPEQGLKISQAVPLQEKAQALMQQGKDKVQEAATQVMGAVNSLTEPAKPKQTLDQGFAEMLATIDADEKGSTTPAPEPSNPEKVKDRLLFADGQLQPGVTKQDMLAITELFTAKKGEMLQGNSAKGLTVEYDGQLLLKTDKDGRVETNNLQNQDLMANFDFRAKNDIAEFQAQAEQLKPQLKEAIQAEVQDLAKLKSQVKERLNDSLNTVNALDPKIPSVQEFNSPEAQRTHQDFGSNRLDVPQRTTTTPQIQSPVDRRLEDALMFMAGKDDGAKKIDNRGYNATDTAFGKRLADKISAKTPLTQDEAKQALEVLHKYRKTQLEPAGQQLPRWSEVAHQYCNEAPQVIKSPPIPAPQQNSKTLDRLARGMSVAFNSNYKGEYPAQGKVQAPTGAVIEKTITDEKTKSFDLAIAKDGQKHQIASCKDGQFTIKEGMSAALPEIQQIAQCMGGYGKFETPAIVPRMEQDQEQQTQQEKVSEPQLQESYER